MAQTRLIRFFPLGTSFVLLVLLVVACGDEATLTPSPSLAPTLSPTSTPEPISPEPTPTTVTPTPVLRLHLNLRLLPAPLPRLNSSLPRYPLKNQKEQH